jgi:hypothetical protein
MPDSRRSIISVKCAYNAPPLVSRFGSAVGCARLGRGRSGNLWSASHSRAQYASTLANAYETMCDVCWESTSRNIRRK